MGTACSIAKIPVSLFMVCIAVANSIRCDSASFTEPPYFQTYPEDIRTATHTNVLLPCQPEAWQANTTDQLWLFNGEPITPR